MTLIYAHLKVTRLSDVVNAIECEDLAEWIFMIERERRTEFSDAYGFAIVLRVPDMAAAQDARRRLRTNPLFESIQ